VTLTGTTIIRGVEIEVASECDPHWVDDSFSHEFGTEVCGHAEVETIYPVYIDCGLRECVLSELEYLGKATKRNRRFKKLVRHLERDIKRTVDKLDPDTFWTDKQIEAAVEGWEPPEPDYD
jgi:hypothetical protein